MDFPVPAEFVDAADAAQLHDEARGARQKWPASFVEVESGQWVYRVDRDDIDRAAVQAAIDGHVQAPPDTTKADARDALRQARANWATLTAAQKADVMRHAITLLADPQ